MKIAILITVTFLHFLLLFLKFENKNLEIKEKVKIPIKTQMNISSNTNLSKKLNEEASVEKEVSIEKKASKIKKTQVDKTKEAVIPNPKAKIPSKIKEKFTTETVVENSIKEPEVEVSNSSAIEDYHYSGEIYTADSSKGVDYKILKEINPNYPPRIKNMLGRDEVTIKTKFLVDKNGKVSTIEFVEENNKLLQQEVEKALKKWVFKPMNYKGKPLEVYFYKEFKFR